MLKSIALAAVALSAVAATNVPAQYFKCVNKLCVPQAHGSKDGVAFSVCRTTCSDKGSLWPSPSGAVKIGSTMVAFNSHSVEFSADTAAGAIDGLKQSFLSVITHRGKVDCSAGSKLTVRLEVNDLSTPRRRLTLDTDESYSFTVSSTGGNVKAVIKAANAYGARHGLMTLSQLVAQDEITGELKIVTSATVDKDAPKFAYRGLALDTSRNFYPIDTLKKLIDGLALNKMNVFHWHMSDSSSFPVEFLKQPKITEYGAYSKTKVYTQADIKSLVAYGKANGVRVVPEVDGPAHMGAGWQWGPTENKGDFLLCHEAQPWTQYCLEPPCGQVNPVNKNIYPVIQDVYDELTAMFNSDLFHMGGDEVHVGCWNSSKVIQQYFAENKLDVHNTTNFLALQGQFHQKALGLLKNVVSKNGQEGSKAILWGSDITKDAALRSQFFDKDNYIFQLWDAQTTNEVVGYVNQGYKVILSHYDSLYFDCGYSGWVNEGNGWCGPPKSWQLVYDFPVYANVAADQQKLVLGAEAALWSEQASPENIDQRLWPKTAALAERLWSNPSTNWYHADDRMQYHRYRLMNLGINADMTQPEWCLNNQGQCSLDPSAA